jgi:polar amino acid transport system substrate-binding protein
MKRWRLFLILCLWCTGTTQVHAQDSLILCRGQNHPMTAIATGILTEAYSRLGIKIKTIAFPIARSLIMANSGYSDGELFRGSINHKKFPNLIKIPVVLDYGQIVVFSKELTFKVNGWSSLQPYTIGIQIGIKEVETGTAGMQVDPVATPEQLFNKLILGRNQIIVLPLDVGLMVMKAMKLQQIKILEPPLQKDPLYHYLHHTHKQLVPRITAVLKQMEAEGLITQIREKVGAKLCKYSG